MSTSLAQKLRLYFDIFSQRPDVLVVEDRRLPPLSRRDRARLAGELPPALGAFSSVLGGIDFIWVLDAHKDERSQYIPGYRGGRLRILPIRELRWQPRDEWIKEGFERYAVFDRMVEEGTAHWAYGAGDGPETAWIGFENSNDCRFSYMGSLEEYLTQGARSGFVWYWQSLDWEGQEFLQRLRDASVPTDTPAEELDRRLIAAGASSEEACALRVWLEEDVVLLLHAGA